MEDADLALLLLRTEESYIVNYVRLRNLVNDRHGSVMTCLQGGN